MLTRKETLKRLAPPALTLAAVTAISGKLFPRIVASD
jgi:hypothetical protein